MLGSDILLFPDTGDEFIRALKTSVLYSRRTFAYTNVLSPYVSGSQEVILMHSLMKRAQEMEMGPGPKRRFVEYAAFVATHNSDLVMLQKEGVLEYPGDRASEALQKLAPSDLERVREIAERLMNSTDPMVSPILKAYECQVPTLMDFIGAEIGAWSDPEWMRYWFFTLYLASLSVIAERMGIALISWSSPFQDAVWAARTLLLTGEESGLSAVGRRAAEARLGTIALERYLPISEDLPFQEILEIRQKRDAELEAFRIGIRELATQIDPTHPPENVELAIHDIVASKIDPAVRNLQAAVYSSRLDVIKKLGQSWNSLATATVPFVLSFAAGAPLSVSAAIALLGPIASSLIEAEVDRRKLLHASQWSILLTLKNSM